MSEPDLKELVRQVNDVTKDLDASIRAEAFKMVLSYLLGGKSTTTRASESQPKKEKPSDKPKGKGSSPASVTTLPVDLKAGKDKKSLRDFYKEKAPESHREKLTVFVYYLNKIAGVPEALAGHVLTCYNDVGERKPTAIRQLFVDTIADKAWLERGEAEGSVKVTVNGENLVEQDLPRKKG